MKNYVKPEIEVLSLRLEERIAGCNSNGEYTDPVLAWYRVGQEQGGSINSGCWTGGAEDGYWTYTEAES